MLLRVEQVQEVGRFGKLRHKAPQFDRLSLVYARNGYGKSTLCSIIRSVAEQSPGLIATRRRLGAVSASAVTTKWTTGDIGLGTSGWSAHPGVPVHIFDQEYVRNHLHIADSVTIENKRRLVPVVLGDAGVTLARRVTDLDNELKALGNKIAVTEKAIRGAWPVISDVTAYALAPVPSTIEADIEKAQRELELAKQGAAVRERPVPTAPALINLDAMEKLCQTTVDDINDQAAVQVASHLSRHGMKPHGERWLEYGVQHMASDECPFCTQDTQHIGLVQVFKGFFGEAYKQLGSDLTDAENIVTGVYGSDGAQLQALLQANSTSLEVWARVAELTPLALKPDEQKLIVEAVRSVSDLLAAKRQHPLQLHQLPDREATVRGLELLDHYSKALSACVQAIDTAKATATGGGLDTAKAQANLDRKRALKAKATSPLLTEIDEYRKDLEDRKLKDEEKKQAQEALRAYAKSISGEKQDKINEILDLFGASFRLTDTKASFVGREPNADYSIAIGPHAVKAGEYATDKPSFTTLLSAGDKYTLALALFITQVRASPALQSSVLVFDDPFSSQDMNRQWETTSQLRSLAKACKQIIVFSHDPRFLHLIHKNDTTTNFQITCDDAGSGAISVWSPEDEIKDLYVQQAERIREYASTGTLLPGCTAESLIKDLRPFLEDYIKHRFPGRFPDLIMLDGMASEIEDVGADDPLFSRVGDLRALNEYSRDNMHGGAAAPDPSALKAQCKRVIRIIGSY